MSSKCGKSSRKEYGANRHEVKRLRRHEKAIKEKRHK
jgi:hypothetical protein